MMFCRYTVSQKKGKVKLNKKKSVVCNKKDGIAPNPADTPRVRMGLFELVRDGERPDFLLKRGRERTNSF